MPLYQSHKKVSAMKIGAIEFEQDGSAVIAPASIHAKYGNRKTGPGYRERFKGDEEDLGYYVRYADNYESWSPTKAFEEGYTLVD